MKSKALVIGVGNVLLRDDGVGIHVIRALKERYRFSPEVELIDGGTMGLDLLPFFENGKKILIVDAVDFHRAPGYVGDIEKDNLPAILHSKLSVHDVGVGDALLAAALLGVRPEKICLLGIQPECIDVGLEMSERIKPKAEEVIGLVIRKLESWQVTCVLQRP